jgi:hypothetical protein
MSSPSYVFNICETPVLWATQEVWSRGKSCV